MKTRLVHGKFNSSTYFMKVKFPGGGRYNPGMKNTITSMIMIFMMAVMMWTEKSMNLGGSSKESKLN